MELKVQSLRPQLLIIGEKQDFGGRLPDSASAMGLRIGEKIFHYNEKIEEYNEKIKIENVKRKFRAMGVKEARIEFVIKTFERNNQSRKLASFINILERTNADPKRISKFFENFNTNKEKLIKIFTNSEFSKTGKINELTAAGKYLKSINLIKKAHILFGFKLDIGAINSALSIMAENVANKSEFMSTYEKYTFYLRAFEKKLEGEKRDKVLKRKLQIIRPTITGVHSSFSTLYREYLTSGEFEKRMMQRFLTYALKLFEQHPNPEKILLYKTLKMQSNLMENLGDLSMLEIEATELANKNYQNTMLNKKFFSPQENSSVLNIIIAEYGELVKLLTSLKGNFFDKNELEQISIDAMVFCPALEHEKPGENKGISPKKIDDIYSELFGLINNGKYNSSIQFVFGDYITSVVLSENFEKVIGKNPYYLQDIDDDKRRNPEEQII